VFQAPVLIDDVALAVKKINKLHQINVRYDKKTKQHQNIEREKHVYAQWGRVNNCGGTGFSEKEVYNTI